MHNLKKFNMNRKYRVRIRCLTFLVTLFWLPLHAQEAGKEFRPAGEPISYAEKDNRKKSPEPLEDQKDKLKKQRIITAKGRVTDAAGEPLIGVNVLIKESGTGQVTDLNGEFKLPDIRFGSRYASPLSDTKPSRSMRGKICALPCMKTGQNWMK